MAELKTNPNDASVEDFLNSVEDAQKRADSWKVLEMMEEISKSPAKMWGPSIVGFGTYHYVYPSGKSGDWMLTGFSPRKQALTLYLMSGHAHFEDDLKILGKHKIGKSCLYIKKLSDIDEQVLRNMIKDSIDAVKRRYS
jgi:hypothetical protein